MPNDTVKKTPRVFIGYEGGGTTMEAYSLSLEDADTIASLIIRLSKIGVIIDNDGDTAYEQIDSGDALEEFGSALSEAAMMADQFEKKAAN